MAAGENRFVRELNEKEVIELFEDLSWILGAFLIKQFFHSRLFDKRWLSNAPSQDHMHVWDVLWAFHEVIAATW